MVSNGRTRVSDGVRWRRWRRLAPRAAFYPGPNFILKDGACIWITIINGLSQRWYVAINNQENSPVASKPPSKGLFIQKKKTPKATMDGSLHWCWRMTSHLMISSVEFHSKMQGSIIMKSIFHRRHKYHEGHLAEAASTPEYRFLPHYSTQLTLILLLYNTDYSSNVWYLPHLAST